MNLYLANGIYFGTQADARKVDRSFAPVDVPTDKAGLIAYLNDISVAAKPPASAPESSVVAPPPVAAARPLSAANVIAKMDAFQAVPDSQKLTVLEEAIQNANGFQLASLIGNVMSRLEELRRDAKLA